MSEELTHATPGADSIYAISALAIQGQEPRIIRKDLAGQELAAPIAYVPEGLSLQSLAPHLAPTPKATATFDETESFVQYLLGHATFDTIVLCLASKLRFEAILDYHKEAEDEVGDAGSIAREALTKLHRPCLHRAALQLQKSDELREWEEAFGKWISQEALAEWLEDHAHQVATPSSAEILTIARELQIAGDVKFTSSKRLSDGGFNFGYTDNRAGHAGDLEVPGQIVVSIPLFPGDEPMGIQCLLRYRLENGQVRFLLRPLRLQETIRAAVQEVRRAIETGASRKVLAGSISV